MSSEGVPSCVVQLDAGDVSIQDAPDEECDGCTASPAHKIVVLDLRNNGETHCLGRYCAECAEEFAARLRASLPPEQPEEAVHGS